MSVGGPIIRSLGRSACLLAIAVTCVLVPATASATAPAAPDPTFGREGELHSTRMSVTELLARPDGSFYVLATRSTSRPFTSMLQLRRADGSLDRSFGGGDGEVTIDVPSSFGPASMHSAHLLADGRILMYGYPGSFTDNFLLDAPDDRIVLVRLLADGSPDPTFSGDGYMWHPAYQGTGESYSTIRLVPASAPVGAFALEVTEDARTSLQAFDASGRLDTSFGEDGAVRVDLDDDVLAVHAGTGTAAASVAGWAAVPGGGWMLVARTSWREACPEPVDNEDGTTTITHCTHPAAHERRLYRYTSAGTLDPAFGSGGRVVLADPTRTDMLYGGEGADGTILLQQDDGRLLVLENGEAGTTVTRWTTDGRPDDSWSGDGVVTLAERTATGYSMYLSSAAIDARGRVVVSFSGYAWGEDETFVLRITADGRRDVTFDRFNSWMPVLRGREHTGAWIAVVPDALGRVLWWTDLSSLECCPQRGGLESIIGTLANGDVAAPEPTLRARFAGVSCGGREAVACVTRRARTLTLVGTLAPVPPAGHRDVYVAMVEPCDRDFTEYRLARVDDRGRFALRLRFPARSKLALYLRREAWGEHADTAARPLWVGRTRCAR